MTFDEILEHVIALLKRQGRVSYGALKMRFEDIADASLDVLKEEILYVHESDVQADERGFTWTGETDSPKPEVQREVDGESRFHALLPAVMALLQRDRRVTYRTLKHIMGIDGALVEEIRKECERYAKLG
jgi:hypothetical protein